MYEPRLDELDEAELEAERRAIADGGVSSGVERDLKIVGGPDPNIDYDLARLAGGP